MSAFLKVSLLLLLSSVLPVRSFQNVFKEHKNFLDYSRISSTSMKYPSSTKIYRHEKAILAFTKADFDDIEEAVRLNVEKQNKENREIKEQKSHLNTISQIKSFLEETKSKDPKITLKSQVKNEVKASGSTQKSHNTYKADIEVVYGHFEEGRNYTTRLKGKFSGFVGLEPFTGKRLRLM